MQEVFLQTGKTREFLELYRRFRAAGVRPLVLKGLICRSLYPQSDHRPSGDEDILIPPEQFDTAHRVLLDFGMEAEAHSEHSYEIPYRKAGSPLFIELHKSLFPAGSGAYGHLNQFFQGIHDTAVEETVQGLPILTPAPTEHLFYLICHAFKHFLHSGVGIRQVCDMALYAQRHGGDIHWQRLLENCRSIRCEKFAAALFRIGEIHLGIGPAADVWQEIPVDEEPLLLDLLASGIYGMADKNRHHAGTITLTAAQNQQQGKAASGILSSLFPAARVLEGRDPYRKKYPGLLPVAWATRLFRYGRGQNSAADSLRIGRERIALMQRYGILDE